MEGGVSVGPFVEFWWGRGVSIAKQEDDGEKNNELAGALSPSK